jgi:predicted alpha-1,2-mannosidase
MFIKQFSKLLFNSLVLVLFFSCKDTTQITSLAASEQTNSLVDFVNPLMGTDSDFSLSNGNTYPAIATPWGMNFWTPMTSKMGDGWTYKYDENTIRGIKQTHQPSPWINDYAAFSIMATTGPLEVNEDKRASWFSHKSEVVQPDFYSVYLADYDVTMSVTPTERAAQFKFSFPESTASHVILDGFFKGSMVKIIPEERKIIGYCRNNNGGVPENFHNYFVAVFDTDFEMVQTWTDGWKLMPQQTEQEGEHVGAVVSFNTKKGQEVHMKVASSFISPAQAEINLNREIGSDSFEETKLKATTAWEKELGRIMVSGSDQDQLKTFYSCLYRVLLFPRKFYEYNAQNEVVHYSPYNGKVEAGYMFTDNGFWDTFRAVFPFFNLMYPDLNAQILEGLANTYKESGWLPEWASPGHRDSMIGSNSAPIIADALIQGVSADQNLLLEALLKNATESAERPVNSVGRAGVDYYNELGYVPYNVGVNENAARTLEYAYADFSIGQLAKKMGQFSLADQYFKKALNYKNLLDPETKWMRGKNEDGTFQSPFNPLKWGDAFTEGNSLHYTWSVFHDIAGLANEMGGLEVFESQLDLVFDMPPLFDSSYYGFTIHEIREMQIANMGNYAHGNQPIQHMIYLYNYAGKPWKTQSKIREVLTSLYTPAPDGYCGDEDNGQTSAWYVFSAMGFYPVAPVTGEYVLGSPLFDKVSLKLQNGNVFDIIADHNSETAPYIQKATLNNADWNASFLKTDAVQQGGVLRLEMSEEPNLKRATDPEAFPYSMSTHELNPS